MRVKQGGFRSDGVDARRVKQGGFRSNGVDTRRVKQGGFGSNEVDAKRVKQGGFRLELKLGLICIGKICILGIVSVVLLVRI